MTRNEEEPPVGGAAVIRLRLAGSATAREARLAMTTHFEDAPDITTADAARVRAA